ncbi:MAG TPA: MFS transporter [Solirubrobacteraceae bacterium]|nr:MFS transporter [Solirubrobacteraceae bacterium]
MTRRLARWFAGYRSALSHRDLRLLLGGLVISATGNWAYNVALLAYVFERTHSLGWVAAAGLVRFVPALLLSAYGGVIAERTERVRLMVGADVVCAVWQAAMAAVAATGGPVVLALVFTALTSGTNVVYDPAVAATIPSVVGEDDLVAANALNGTIENVIVIAGPAVGAVLLLVGSPALVFSANAVSFAISAVIVSRIRARSRPVDVTEEGTAGALRQMALGVRTIAGLRAARVLVAFCALVSLVYGTDSVLFVGVSEHRLGTGSEGFGYLLAALGIGGILMAAAVDKLAASRRLAPIIIAGVAGYCLPTALLTVITSPALAFVLEVVRGGSTLIVDVLAVTALQRSVASDQLARVFGVFFAFVLGAISLGTLITPPIVSGLGLDAALLTLSFVPFALGAVGFPALLAIDRETAARTLALAPRVAVLEKLEIFATASRPVLDRLAAAATEVAFPARTAIVREGDPAHSLYVLVEGEVEVTARGEGGGPERTIRTMIAPTYFGEIGVLGHIPRTATVTAVTDCRCDEIDGDALLDALTSAPPSATLMENARSRLSLTHPSRPVTFAAEDAGQRA